MSVDRKHLSIVSLAVPRLSEETDLNGPCATRLPVPVSSIRAIFSSRRAGAISRSPVGCM